MAGRILKITKGGGSGGNNTEVQYNNAGALGGCAQLFWDSANDRLGLGDSTPAQQLSITKCVELLETTASDVGVIYKGASRYFHNFRAAGADGHNTFIGLGAGNFSMAISGQTYHTSNNVGIGSSTLAGVTTGYNNLAFGTSALTGVTTGHDNCGFGRSSGFSCSAGSYNCTMGYATLYHNVSGSHNTVLGCTAGKGVAGNSISHNTLIGKSAGFALTTGGDDNVMIGYQAGDNVTSGEQNIIIGYNLNALAAASDYQLNIGGLIFGDLGGTKKVGVNTSTMNETLNVGGAIRLGTSALTNNGTIRWTGTDFEGYKTGWKSLTGLKEFFIPVTSCSAGTLGGKDAYGAAVLENFLDAAHINFRVPPDFSSLVSAAVVVLPVVTTGAANWDTWSNYAQTGEAYQAHNQSDIATTYNVTSGYLFEVNVAGLLTSLAANDNVGIRLLLGDATHDVNVLGLNFKYS